MGKILIAQIFKMKIQQMKYEKGTKPIQKNEMASRVVCVMVGAEAGGPRHIEPT